MASCCGAAGKHGRLRAGKEAGLGVEKRYHIPVAHGPGRLAAILHLPDGDPRGGVVCCHGMLSSKESSKLAAVADALSCAGFGAVRFDFSGCGESGSPEGGGLIASRLQDLTTVIDHVLAEPWLKGGLGLMGSSLGGYLSILAAARRPEVRAAVCWATPYDLRKIQAAMASQEPLRLRFPPGFQVGGPLDLSELRGLRRVLVMQGWRDETVPWAEGLSIYERLGEPRRFMLFEQADHRFTDEGCRELAIRATVDWLRHGLKTGLTAPGRFC
jgi:alpha-beta hydrolase superfamily lysophospholipase